MQILLFLSLLTALISCGVKEAPPAQTNPVVGTGQTQIDGVLITNEKKFLIKASRPDFVVDPLLKIGYRIVDKNLESIPSQMTLKVDYNMPKMPQMPVTPAKIEKLDSSHFNVTYDISMEGEWSFTLSILEAGQEIDSVKFEYQVPGAQ